MKKGTYWIIGLAVVALLLIVFSEKNPSTESMSAHTPDFTVEENEVDNPFSEGEVALVGEAGSYEDYDESKLARARDGDVVLFFHASWCPSCRVLAGDIEKNLSNIPGDVSILKVNYDKETELKKKYGITYQHTLVQVDADGEMIQKWSGGSTLESIIEKI